MPVDSFKHLKHPQVKGLLLRTGKYTDYTKQSYLHKNRLAELFSVDNLYGNFLACDTVDAQLHKT